MPASNKQNHRIVPTFLDSENLASYIPASNKSWPTQTITQLTPGFPPDLCQHWNMLVQLDVLANDFMKRHLSRLPTFGGWFAWWIGRWMCWVGGLLGGLVSSWWLAFLSQVVGKACWAWPWSFRLLRKDKKTTSWPQCFPIFAGLSALDPLWSHPQIWPASRANKTITSFGIAGVKQTWKTEDQGSNHGPICVYKHTCANAFQTDKKNKDTQPWYAFASCCCCLPLFFPSSLPSFLPFFPPSIPSFLCSHHKKTKNKSPKKYPTFQWYTAPGLGIQQAHEHREECATKSGAAKHQTSTSTEGNCSYLATENLPILLGVRQFGLLVTAIL